MVESRGRLAVVVTTADTPQHSAALDRASRRLLERRRVQALPPVWQLSVEEVRRTREAWRRQVAAAGPGVRHTRDVAMPGPAGLVPTRVYRAADESRPVVVYLHGGGWVLGDLDHSDALCRELCRRSGAVIVNVDYRLAPEHRFPAAPEDAYAVVDWLAEHAPSVGGVPDRLAVVGSSAGGNLAAVTALMARDRDGPKLTSQVLAYPVTDHRFDTASYEAFADGFVVSREDMRWYWRQYLADPRDGAQPYASPLRVDDTSGLPPALVVVAGNDPLRDDGIGYAKALTDGGVRCTCSVYGGALHGFLALWTVQRTAHRALGEISDFLRATLSISSI